MILHQLIHDLSLLPTWPWRIEAGKLLSLHGEVLAENVDPRLHAFLVEAPAVVHRLSEDLCTRERERQSLRKMQTGGIFARELGGKRRHP